LASILVIITSQNSSVAQWATKTRKTGQKSFTALKENVYAIIIETC